MRANVSLVCAGDVVRVRVGVAEDAREEQQIAGADRGRERQARRHRGAEHLLAGRDAMSVISTVESMPISPVTAVARAGGSVGEVPAVLVVHRVEERVVGQEHARRHDVRRTSGRRS